MKNIGKIIKKLKVSDNSVLLIKKGDNDPEKVKEQFEGLRQAIEKIGLKNIVIAIVEDTDQVRALPEIEMNRYGWFRSEQLKKLILRKEEKEKPDDAGSEPGEQE